MHLFILCVSIETECRYFGTSCEIGRVAPLYGFLEDNVSQSKENIRLLLRAQFQALQENGLHDLMGILAQL